MYLSIRIAGVGYCLSCVGCGFANYNWPISRTLFWHTPYLVDNQHHLVSFSRFCLLPFSASTAPDRTNPGIQGGGGKIAS